MDGHWEDHSVLEAASWRLASELTRRHPTTTRLLLTHPGSGMYNCLTIYSLNKHVSGRPGIEAAGTIQLNRAGTIQVHERFDGREADWPATTWDEYLRADPRKFLGRLEAAAGLPTPTSTPAATPVTLTHRILAAIAAAAAKTVDTVVIDSGYIDSSGDDGGPNEVLRAFQHIPPALLEPRTDDLFGQPGYRFWLVLRRGQPLLAFERRAGLTFTMHGADAIPIMKIYRHYRRNLHFTMAKVMRMADNF